MARARCGALLTKPPLRPPRRPMRLPPDQPCLALSVLGPLVPLTLSTDNSEVSGAFLACKRRGGPRPDHVLCRNLVPAPVSTGAAHKSITGFANLHRARCSVAIMGLGWVPMQKAGTDSAAGSLRVVRS